MSYDGARFQFFHVEKIKTSDGLNGLTAREHEEDSDHENERTKSGNSKKLFSIKRNSKERACFEKTGVGELLLISDSDYFPQTPQKKTQAVTTP